MADLDHFWGGDLALSPTGDLATVEGAVRGEQRIVRRLCTNGRGAIDQVAGEYLFHPAYGAGLPRYVGQPTSALTLEGIAREQMLNEAAAVQSPPPDVSVTKGALGTATLDIAYIDAATRTPRTLTLDVTE